MNYREQLNRAFGCKLPTPARLVYLDLWRRMWQAQEPTTTVTQRDLAKSTGLAPSTVTRAVGVLEGSGLVVRAQEGGQGGGATVYTLEASYE